MTINSIVLQEELDHEGIPNEGVDSNGKVYFTPTATTEQRERAAQIVAAHNPASLTSRQQSLAQLVVFLDSRAEDLKYADYLYRLQKAIIDLWRDKPALIDRYNAVITALKANKASDANHAAMWNTYLDMAAVEYGLTVTAGEIVISGTTQQQAAQARSAIECARSFLNTGVTMVNELLLNQRL